MSHYHHDDEDTQMSGITNTDNTKRRHSSHRLHLKPTAVLEHIKTKVKRKRSTHNASLEVPAFTVHSNNNNNNTKRVNHDHNEIQSKTAHSRSITLSDQYSDDSNDHKYHEENNASVRNDIVSVIVSSHVDEDEDANEGVQSRTDHIEADIDVNQKNTKSKPKLIKKVSKVSAESAKALNTKKRQQKILRTGFQIRDQDFNKIFNDLPSDERLIVAYPCAWRKDVFIHGRLFLSIHYVCFYTCFFKLEESLCIAYKDIGSVTKEKSGKGFSNAIKLRTSNGVQYIFTGDSSREQAFAALSRLWQNSLLENPLDYQQLRTAVNTDPMSHDEASEDSEGSIGLENNNEHSSNHRTHSQSLPTTSDRLTELLPVRIASLPPNQEVISSPQDKEQVTYPSACPCETHLTRTHCDRLYSYPVDNLFDLIYGDNSFSHAYHESQKLTEYTMGEWRINNETSKRERQVTYKTITQSILGTNTLLCNEKQIIEAEKPRSLYVISAEVYNEGMRYTDAFCVATRFCMFQRDAKHSSLHITAEIRYIKSVNGIAKAFIEKNANSSIEGVVTNLIGRLDSQQAAICNRKPHEKQESAQDARKRKHDKEYRDHRKDKLTMNNVVSSDSQVLKKEKAIIGDGFFFNIAVLIGILLVLFHIFLCYKLYAIDRFLYAIDTGCLDQCKKTCLRSKNHI